MFNAASHHALYLVGDLGLLLVTHDPTSESIHLDDIVPVKELAVLDEVHTALFLLVLVGVVEDDLDDVAVGVPGIDLLANEGAGMGNLTLDLEADEENLCVLVADRVKHLAVDELLDKVPAISLAFKNSDLFERERTLVLLAVLGQACLGEEISEGKRRNT
jgi:uncharacterized membrane protein